jgi:3-oxo-4-pregnene-20-carboxyl-CoA dehydrogenase alpha subunit
MMDFTPGDSQQAVATLAAEVLTAADPWKELAQAGLLDASPPDGLSVLDTATLLTEIGRHAPQVAMKALATLMTGAVPVARWGDDDLKQALLPAVASGELLLTASRRGASLGADVSRRGVSGTAIGVLHAAEARRVLVPVASGVVLIDPRSEGVTLTRTPASSGQPEYALRMDRVRVAGMLGGPGGLAGLENLAVAGACALIDGAVAGALALTRDHVATRQQFGRPLAAFQAVSQQIAEVYIASRTMHLATLSACWRLSEGRDPGADLAVAGYWCAEQASRAVRLCHHLHGGLGMDVTYPLHRFSALVADLTRYLGGAEYRLERHAAGAHFLERDVH